MSAFELAVLGLLVLIAVLVIACICVAVRAACNARDAKDEAEQERLLVRGTGVTPEQLQQAVEQVLHTTGALDAIRAAAQYPPMITAGDHSYRAGDRRQIVPAAQVERHEQYPPGHPANGFRAVPMPAAPQFPPRVQQREQYGPPHNGREPVLAGTNGFATAAPFIEQPDRQALRRSRDPLGIHPTTDTQPAIPVIRDDTPRPSGIEDPDADLTAIQREWAADAETTQGWSLAWNGGSGEYPEVTEDRPQGR
ncbi:MAG TPA: hypothetical protein VJM32_00860 [Candidatus Saccharimonadales bacterium]|nr:hypothetical protein [Candidatus Saccharimonadales bacterium]